MRGKTKQEENNKQIRQHILIFCKHHKTFTYPPALSDPIYNTHIKKEVSHKKDLHIFVYQTIIK